MDEQQQPLDEHEKLMKSLQGDEVPFLPINNRITQFLEEEPFQQVEVKVQKAEDVFPMGKSVASHLDEEFNVLYETAEDGTTIATIL
jgi:hypothetical protein|tara:strand:+ start:629 stop:889 length:261 start_codon:yes stop_codon:yes gene_type:complete